ncbi:hypothetical protein GUITHDRAFT_132444 [Guillardia theta CCMP2712]|uniref:Uncharacterized protein n=1 Tax=Guillardia theta (strain CCMP2712) TaxID=905079 RepID=L1K0P7_GUITC|nr:hypothetical protein GUITHDRAFT_132444 [Guillardia theta CCMP2712]EKX54025.1 hypothetical protein GUITHDRAFT_132444 [Guillardia theta CCMP2712]|eukprot:XP_005841005.1 hypothetical protein GUITHDRAFT_132444 [Guillardia theta CCMP2712]
MSGAGDKAFYINQQELEKAEQQLEEAVASNDIGAISRALAKLEKIQGPLAGKKPFDKSSVDKAKETDLINSVLGKQTETPAEAAEDLADTIAGVEAAEKEIEIQALEQYLDESIVTNDAESVQIAISKLRALKPLSEQEAEASKGSVDEVADAVALALERAAIEEGHDVDIFEILEGVGNKNVRVQALGKIIDDAVSSNDSKLLEKALRTLEKLMGDEAGSAVSGQAVDPSLIKDLLSKTGIENLQSAQAAQEISDVIAQVEGVESELGDDEDEDVWRSLREIQDKRLKAAAIERLLDEAIESGDEDLLADCLLSLRFVEVAAIKDSNKNLEKTLRALRELTGREVSQQEAFEFAVAIQTAHESTEWDGVDMFDKVQDKKLAIGP